MLPFLFLLVLILGLFWYFCVKPLKYWSSLGIKQTKHPVPFFGDAWGFMSNSITAPEFIQKIYNLYPVERYVGLYHMQMRVLMIRDPELIKRVLVKDFDHFTDHAKFLDNDSDPLWNSALFNMNGEKWKVMRNTLSPAFSSSKLKLMHKLMVDISRNFVEYMDDKPEDLFELEMKETYTRLTNDIIATTAFGVEVNSLKQKDNIFYEMGKRITDVTGFWNTVKFAIAASSPRLGKLLGVTAFDKKAATYFCNIVEETIQLREKNSIDRPDIINVLLEARNAEKDRKFKQLGGISNFEIGAQSLIFFFAGLDTVSTTMCFGSYELAMNKDIQDKLRKEIKDTANKLAGRDLTYDDVMDLKYMDLFLQETLRKWPPFQTVDRACTKTIVFESDNPDESPLTINKDQVIWLPTFPLQRDARFYPDPEKFDPERFSDANKDKLVPYTLLPFGIGPRSCIANRFALIEIKTMFYYLLSSYELVPTDKTPEKVVLKNTFQTIPEGGFHLGLKRLSSSPI